MCKNFPYAACKMILLIIFFYWTTFTKAQQTKIDSLKRELVTTKADTIKIDLLEQLGQSYRDSKKMDSSVLSFQQALEINEKTNYSLQRQCWNTAAIGYLLYEIGNYTESLKYAVRHLALSEKLNDTLQKGMSHLVFGHDYRELGEYRKSLNHYFKAKNIFKIYHQQRNHREDNTYTILCIAQVYLKMNRLDSALLYTRQSYNLAKDDPGGGLYILLSTRIFGDIYFAKGEDETALKYYRQYVPDFVKYNEKNRDLGFVLNNMAKIFQKRNQRDSVVFYAEKALDNAKTYHDQENIFDAATSLYHHYSDKADFKKEQAAKETLDKSGAIEYHEVINSKIAGLKAELAMAKDDSAKIELFMQLGDQYRSASNPDSFIISYTQALELVQKNNYSAAMELRVLSGLDFITNATGNYLMSMNYANRALLLSEQTNDVPGKAFALSNIAANYAGLGELRKALDYYFKAKTVFETYESGHWAIQNIAETYLKMHKLDSALYYNQKAYYIADTGHNQQYMKAFAVRVFAKIYAEQGKDEMAIRYYRQFISDFYKYNLSNREIDRAYFGIAEIYRKQNAIDSSVYYAKKALAAARLYNDQEHILIASNLLYSLNDSMRNESEAFKYFRIATAAKDSMAGIEKIKQMQILAFNEQIREKEQAKADAKEAARVRLIIIIAAIFILITSFLVWARIRQLRLRHKMILEQKETEKLKAIDKMKEKFFTNITHELRTPLSLIMSPTEYYLQHPRQLHNAPGLLESIYKNSGYLLNLINQLLDISKLDAGKMSISLSKGDFGNYIGELTNGFNEIAGKKRIHLQFENQARGEYLFDPGHWKKIVDNLLSNALKFTPAYGNVYVAIKQDEEMGEKCRFQFMVRDTGIGISKEKIPFITDRFYQADNSTTRKYEGAGVGLALVKELIDLMNGRLEISSREGQGSEFSVEVRLQSATGKTGYPALIPFVEYSSVTANNIPGIQVIKEEEKFDKHLVLIAEDNVSLRDFLAESLLTKYQVITASNGEEAFQETLSTMPDVIISDVMMPVMDGFDFCEKVKNDPATSHIGFILLSAKATLESKLAGLKHGADDYLVKPFSVDELQSRIDSLLLRREKLRKHYLQQLISGNGFPSLNGIEDEFLQNTYKNIEDNLDNEHFTVEYLAEKMTLSQNILDRKLSTVIGLSANELIRQYRAKKTEMQKQMLELEAKALRAQMNPHFIFNCLNSIKSLIQEHDEDKAVTYLTTFSKLIRTLFNNADKKEITLFDEIETCKLYLQLEAMRFDAKFSYSINVENDIDLKSIQIPALIIQPFIENAIWHGIVPRNTGGHIVLDVAKKNDMIEVSVEDDGIGRESSKRNKSISSLAHKSKGVNLTQTRLELNNLLQQRQAMLEILDKKDENGVAMGTMVIIKITEEKL